MNIKIIFQKNRLKIFRYFVFGCSSLLMPIFVNAMEPAHDETALVNTAQQSLTFASDQLQDILRNYQQAEQDPLQLNDHIGNNIGFLRQTVQSLEQVQARNRELLGHQLDERDLATNRLLTATVENIRRNVTTLADSLESMRRDHAALADGRQGTFRTRLSGLARQFIRSWRPGFVIDYHQRLQEASQREHTLLRQMQTLFDILGNRRYNLPQRVDQQPTRTVSLLTGREYYQQPRTVVSRMNRALLARQLFFEQEQEGDQSTEDTWTEASAATGDTHVMLDELASDVRARQHGNFSRLINHAVRNIGEQRIQPLRQILDNPAFDYPPATNVLNSLPASSPFRIRWLEVLYRTADNNQSAAQNGVDNQSQEQQVRSWWQRLWGKIKYNSARLVRGVLRKIVGRDRLDAMARVNARYQAAVDDFRNRLRPLDERQKQVRIMRDEVRNVVAPDRYQPIDGTVVHDDALRVHMQSMVQGWQQQEQEYVEG